MKTFWVLFAAFVANCVAAPIQTLDLKPFVGPSRFDTADAGWLLPLGPQVLDGTPFQLDGVVFVYGNNASQRTNPGKTNINHIPVGRAFHTLHLLMAAHGSSTDGLTIAKFHFQYTDGSTSAVDIVYGRHVRNWFGPLHKKEPALLDTNVREGWRAQHAAAAASDEYVRMFHVPITNPAPEKEVRSLSIESTKTPSGMLIAGISVGPDKAERLADTIPLSKNFPDLSPRQGQSASATGIVRNKKGEPLPGALVMVTGTRAFNTISYEASSAGPAIGIRAIAGVEGCFTLPPLPDNQLYNLVVHQRGFKGGVFNGLDPKLDPIEVRLTPDTGKIGNFAAKARIVDQDDKPVPYAYVQRQGVGTEESTSWGSSEDLPDNAIADEKGEFLFSRDKPFTRVQVEIRVPTFAAARVWLQATNIVNFTNFTNVIKLGPGATVTGRVLKDGKPLSGVKVGVAGAERNSEVFAGHYEARTDTNGTFTFTHLPPHTSWNFYGIVTSLRSHGALSPTLLLTGNDGESKDLGDLAVIPGLRLTGTVKTRDGSPLPKNLKVRLGFEDAWDSHTSDTDENGAFAFTGLSKGQISLSIEPRNAWRLAASNRSLDNLNPWRLLGMLEKDKDGFVLVIEKGATDFNSSSRQGNGYLPDQDRSQNRPISGAEPYVGPPPSILGGRIIDEKTGQPILVATITPGRKPPTTTPVAPPKSGIDQLLAPLASKKVTWNEIPYWDYAHVDKTTNGRFWVEFIRLTSTPMLKIEAPGYEPFESEPIVTNAVNLVFRLKRGSGPNGIILQPDGKPAEGASIVYAVEREQFALNGKVVRTYGNKEEMVTTGKDGKFSFAARPRGVSLFVSHPTGFAEALLEDGSDNLKIRLKKWAAISGTLSHTNGTPAANVKLEIATVRDWQRGDPIMHMSEKIFTDSRGNFLFTNVPPMRIEVNRIIPMGQGGWSSQIQTWLEVEPGITNKLGKVVYDTPPPKSIGEQIKNKLGL